MASSGWQGEKTVYAGSSSAPRLLADLYIGSISHSGTDLSISGTVRIISPSNSGIYYNGAYIWWSGGSTTKNLNSDYGVVTNFDSSFSVTIRDVPYSTTTYSFSIGVNAVQSGESASWTLSFNASGSVPTGLTTSLSSYGKDWADIAVNLGSWGLPSSASGRYIEGAVLGSSTYGNPYRFTNIKTGVSSATLRVDNSKSGNLTIIPNTRYRYGGYASNTVMATSVISGTFITLPETPIIEAIDRGHGVIDFTVTHATEGSALTVTEEYSIDGGSTWVAITGSAFLLALSGQTVVQVRRRTTSGSSSATVTVTPVFTYGIYASIINKTKSIEKGYASVNSKTKKIEKVYASVNGVSKLIYRDSS